MIRGLIPVEVDGLGLRGSLERLVDEVRLTYGVDCEFSSEGSVLIEDSVTATHLYHIAHEALHNAVKHARANKIVASLAADERARLEIRDDGVGMIAGTERSHGMGLRIMRHRANLIGATLRVAPLAGGGTVLTCTLGKHPKG